MVSSELRAEARNALKGKWGKAALLTLCYAVIMFVIEWLLAFIPVVGPIVSLVISLPISFGILATFMKLKRNEDVSYTEFLSTGFSNFGKVWVVFGNMVLKMIVPLVLIVVFIVILAIGLGGSISSLLVTNNSYGSSMNAGFGGLAFVGFIGYFASLIYAIVKGYLYSLSYYILYDNPDKSGKEIVEESERLMKGNRWSFVWLTLTFIGWAILSVFTFYIGFLWLTPYMMVAFVCFYESLAGKTTSTPKEEDTNPVVEE